MIKSDTRNGSAERQTRFLLIILIEIHGICLINDITRFINVYCNSLIIIWELYKEDILGNYFIRIYW